MLPFRAAGFAILPFLCFTNNPLFYIIYLPEDTGKQINLTIGMLLFYKVRYREPRLLQCGTHEKRYDHP